MGDSGQFAPGRQSLPFWIAKWGSVVKLSGGKSG